MPRLRFFLPLGLLLLTACLLERVPDSARESRPAYAPVPELVERLEKHVHVLATEIGQRSYLAPEGLARAALYAEEELRRFENPPTARVTVSTYRVPALPEERLHRCTPVECPVGDGAPPVETLEFRNISLEVRGTTRPEEVIVVGAHYDSDGCESGGCNPGADDNASGTAALFELARLLQDRPLARTVRYVAFTNEEEPFFHTDAMGSLVFARNDQRPGEKIVAMFSLETLGYYSDEPGSQDVPWILDALFSLPTVGNFITFVGDWGSGDLVKLSVAAFQQTVPLSAEGLITYSWVEGVDWSDHWSYRQIDVPAVMVTDTAPNRNQCYHKPCDTADRLDYAKMAQVVEGMAAVVREAAGR